MHHDVRGPGRPRGVPTPRQLAPPPSSPTSPSDRSLHTRPWQPCGLSPREANERPTCSSQRECPSVVSFLLDLLLMRAVLSGPGRPGSRRRGFGPGRARLRRVFVSATLRVKQERREG